MDGRGNKDIHNRRQFINLVARGSIFASLTLLGGFLFRRWDDAPECRKNFACGSCNATNQCQLPEADMFRLEKAKLPEPKAEDGRAKR